MRPLPADMEGYPQPVDAQPKVSVIIVSWNSRDLLRNCLDSLKAEAEKLPLEIIVFDNASTDGTTEMLRDKYLGVQVIASQENLGFAHGNNVAIGRAQGEFVFLLNPDTIVHPDCIALLADYLEGNENTAIVGPKVLEPDGSIQLVCAREFPSLLASFFELSLLRRLFHRSRLFGRYRMEYWDHEGSRDVPCILGAAMFIRKSFLAEHGLLDEKIPMYYEDVEICKRVWDAGQRVHYLTKARVTHFVAKSAALSNQRLFLFVLEQGESYWLYFRDYHGSASAFVFTWIVLVGSIYRIILLSLPALISPVFGRRIRSGIMLAFRKYLSLLSWSFHNKSPQAVMQRNPLG